MTHHTHYADMENSSLDAGMAHLRREGLRQVIMGAVFVGLVILLGYGSYSGRLVTPDLWHSWLWLLAAGVLIALIVHYLFFGLGRRSIAEHAGPRLLPALLAAVALVVVPLVLLALTIPSRVWALLAGNQYYGTASLGGWGIFLLIIFGIGAVVCYVLLVGAILSSDYGWLRIFVWLALTLVFLIPSMGMSVLANAALL